MTETAPVPRTSRAFLPTRRPSRHQLMIGGSGLVLVLAIAFGIQWRTFDRFMIGTENAYVRADVVTVAPHVPGYLVEVNVRDNQIVHAGDLLARIDNRDYRAKVQQAEGALAAAKADVAAERASIANLDAQSQQQQSKIAESAASLQAARTPFKIATSSSSLALR